VEEILINVTPQETRVAVTATGVVQELLIERAASRGLVGNIYVGRVARVLPGMQSAFVEVGLERAAFLHVADIKDKGGSHAAAPIERLLAQGEPILVQVVKDPIGSKGARLSTQVSIAGRTLAESAGEQELRADLAYLQELWKAIQQRSLGADPPLLLYQDLSLAQRVLRDMVTADTARVVVDSRENFQKLAAFAERYMPQVRARLEHYTGERPLFDLHNVEPEIDKALSRRVELKSGGYLIIDQTEAMTTIDVNTGGFVGSRNFDDTVFKTNLEAAQAIARQLRLRNLGGIIIVDFIDMDTPEHRNAVLEELRRALARDRTRVTLNGFTALGLVEMTRKRTRESLAHVLCEPCPTCAGRGEVRTAHTVCYDVLREILREARAFNAREFRVIASQAVIDLLLEDGSASLTLLSDFIGKPISVQVESGYSQEQFDIVLL
jgi:ribonuclease G